MKSVVRMSKSGVMSCSCNTTQKWDIRLENIMTESDIERSTWTGAFGRIEVGWSWIWKPTQMGSLASGKMKVALDGGG